VIAAVSAVAPNENSTRRRDGDGLRLISRCGSRRCDPTRSSTRWTGHGLRRPAEEPANNNSWQDRLALEKRGPSAEITQAGIVCNHIRGRTFEAAHPILATGGRIGMQALQRWRGPSAFEQGMLLIREVPLGSARSHGSSWHGAGTRCRSPSKLGTARAQRISSRLVIDRIATITALLVPVLHSVWVHCQAPIDSPVAQMARKAPGRRRRYRGRQPAAVGTAPRGITYGWGILTA